jgi:hypothetical protein
LVANPIMSARNAKPVRQSPQPYDNFAACPKTAADRKANNRRRDVLCARRATSTRNFLQLFTKGFLN